MADIKALLFLLRRNTEGLQDGPSPARYLADCGVHLKAMTVRARICVTDCCRWGQRGNVDWSWWEM